MKQFIIDNKKIIGYTVYCILLIWGLLYFLFPADTFKEYFQARIQKEAPSILCTIGKVRPALPFGIKLLGNRLALKTDPNMILFETNSLSVRPQLWAFLRSLVKYRFRIFAYGGHIKGTFYLSEDSNRSTNVSLVLNNIRVGDYPLFSVFIGCHIKGLLDGIATYKGQGVLLSDGIGELDVTIADGSLDLSRPINNLESVSFSDMIVKLALKDKSIDLTRVILNGTEVQASLSGTMHLEEDISRSTLDIKGMIKPLAGLSKEKKDILDSFLRAKQIIRKGDLTFTIRGTLEKPVFLFN